MKKLSKMTSLKEEEEKEIPDFFNNLKERFINNCIEMGMDYIEVKDFLDDHCIAEANVELVIDHLKNPNYKNPLVMSKVN